MERRTTKISSCKAGGTAGAGSKTYKLTLPTSWVKQLGSEEIIMSFDGETITLTPKQTPEEFARSRASKGHKMLVIEYYDKKELCSVIYADQTSHEVTVRNYTDFYIKTALGKGENPSWEDLEIFLEERCVPRTRAGLQYFLEELGLYEYDPWEIVKRTEGRMAEDHQWLKIGEYK